MEKLSEQEQDELLKKLQEDAIIEFLSELDGFDYIASVFIMHVPKVEKLDKEIGMSTVFIDNTKELLQDPKFRGTVTKCKCTYFAKFLIAYFGFLHVNCGFPKDVVKKMFTKDFIDKMIDEAYSEKTEDSYNETRYC